MASNWIEVAAVALALAYVVLAIYQQRICWLAAAISAALYVWIFAQVQLYLESALQVFYLAMAGYGWVVWRRRTEVEDLAITTRGRAFHGRVLMLILIGTLLMGIGAQSWTDAVYPFVDAFTTVSALIATWMTARKILENWLYWIAIDTVSIGLYLSRDLSLTAALFGGYVLLAILGYRTWRWQWQHQTLR